MAKQATTMLQNDKVWREEQRQSTVIEDSQAAQRLLRKNRRQGLNTLNEIFRRGSPPHPPLDGRYAGTLVTLDIAPGLTQLSEKLAALWLPWQGKRFDAAQGYG